ncbi:MAG: nitrilase-related carbon-nitrogen hydrolase, partial [Roseimicrobium sp.]
MEPLNIDLWTFDVGVEAESPEAYAQEMASRVRQSWESGADVVVFPEYAWMGLERFVQDEDKLRGVSRLFWDVLWPELQTSLAVTGKAAVLGTVPHGHSHDGKTTLHNRAPILCEGKALYQDKLSLTPWESALSRSDTLHLWKLRGTTFAVLICLDIEVPEYAAALRGKGVDCLLVPSATDSELGVERVGRCASARAVELCAYVGVSQLTGAADCLLVDENVGRLAWLRPSQSPFAESVRMSP